MIRRLVELAKVEGLSAEPTLLQVDGIFIDLADGKIEPRKDMLVRLRQRSGSQAHQVPGWLSEKAANLAPGNPYRESQRRLAEGWAARTQHPLPQAIVEFLDSGSTVPSSDGWAAFGWAGQTAMEIAPLRALMAEDDAPDVMETPERCVACGKVTPPVRLHDGLTVLGNAVPILLCWEREITRFGERTNGQNLPTCPDCMRLYVAYLNRHIDDRKTLHLDGYSYLFEHNNRSAYIKLVAAPGTELHNAWDYALHMNGAWMYKLPVRPPESIEDVPGDRNNMAYMHGYLYGILEWCAWVTRKRCPTIAEVSVAPGRMLFTLLCEMRDAAESYTPPTLTKGRPIRGQPPRADKVTVVGWLRYATHAATLDLKGWISHPLDPDELADFGLGYAHSLGRRGPPRDPDADVSGYTTPWEVALSSALLEAGLPHERQYKVSTSVWVGGKLVEKKAHLDIAFPEAKLAVEVDGRLHGLEIRDHSTDSARAASLLAQGWVVYRVPNKRVTKACADVVAEIAAILRSRASAPVTPIPPAPLATPPTDGSEGQQPLAQL